MRISDWSSDVCSSDLPQLLGVQPIYHPARAGGQESWRSAKGRGVRRVSEAADARDYRPSGDCRGASRARSGKARSGLSDDDASAAGRSARSEEHTSELQSLMRISFTVFCLTTK